MGIEIELKAWIDDLQSLSQILSSIGAEFSGAVEKDDCYWIFPASLQELRVRQETKIDKAGIVTHFNRVTYKTKEIQDGIEINDEQEFEVSDMKVFEELLRRLGAAQKIKKHKQGQAWKYEDINAELFLVRGLGYFIELECISESKDAQTIDNIKSRLMDLLSRLGITKDSIEPRYYTDLLCGL